MEQHLLEFHATNPLNFWSPSLVQNLYILFMMTLVNVLFVLAAWFVIRYLKKFYGERQIPKEWVVFWWAFVFYSLHEIVEMIGLYQWIHGQVFVFLYFSIEIIAVVLLTWGCYLLVKKYASNE